MTATPLRPPGAAFPEHKIVDSSFISLIAYDPTDRMFGVRMKSGKSYVYAGVHEVIWEGMKNCNSAGEEYNRMLKNGSFLSCEQSFRVFGESAVPGSSLPKSTVSRSALAALCAEAWF